VPIQEVNRAYFVSRYFIGLKMFRNCLACSSRVPVCKWTAHRWERLLIFCHRTASLKFWKYLFSQSKLYLPREHQIIYMFSLKNETETIQLIRYLLNVNVSHFKADNIYVRTWLHKIVMFCELSPMRSPI
jgi:hypothetical protein